MELSSTLVMREITEPDGKTLARATFGESAGKIRYAIRLAADSDLGAAGTLVGTSRLSQIDLRNESTHIGGTLYGSRWWARRSALRRRCSYWRTASMTAGSAGSRSTDRLNTRSQAVIARLGAVREGVLRRHVKREDGSFRDTVVYSVLKTEWPEVRTRLPERLAPRQARSLRPVSQAQRSSCQPAADGADHSSRFVIVEEVETGPRPVVEHLRADHLRATTRTAALALAGARAGFTTAEHAVGVRHITGRDGYTTRQFLAGVRNPHSGRKLTVLTSIDRDYQNLRTGMQALFQHIGIETGPAAA